MKNILLISLFFWGLTQACTGQDNLLKNVNFKKNKGVPENWTFVSESCAKFRVVSMKTMNLIQISVDKNKIKKSSPSLMSGGWKPETMIKLSSSSPLKGSIKVRSLAPDSIAFIRLTFRDKNNRWLGSTTSDPIELTAKWSTINVEALPSSRAVYVQFSAHAKLGKIQFKNPILQKVTQLSINPNNPSPEFWLTVDFTDEVKYCRNAGYKTYREKEIANLFRQCKKYKVHGVLWRAAGGIMLYHTKVGTMYPGNCDYKKLKPNQKHMVSILKDIDPLKVAIREARKNNINIYIWMTIADDYGAGKNKGFATNQIVIDHPEYMLLDKNGKPMKGSLCYNVPAVRKFRLEVVKELVNYKADGIYFCTRTHAFYFGKDSGYQYGYNKEIVDEYKKRYGVNILKEKFDKDKWLALRAEGMDQMIEETSKVVHAAGQKTMLSLKTVQNENRGWPWGKAKMNWKKWVKNNWIDSIVIGHYYIPLSRIINDTKKFRKLASKNQKVYFWMQLWHYQKRQQTPLKDLIKQMKTIHFAGANGVICHEAIGLEERVKSYWQPLGDAVKKYWQNEQKAK